MSENIKPGDKVYFRAGRGRAIGSVANVSPAAVTINTRSGKSVNRRPSQVTLVAETEDKLAEPVTVEVDCQPAAVSGGEVLDASAVTC